VALVLSRPRLYPGDGIAQVSVNAGPHTGVAVVCRSDDNIVAEAIDFLAFEVRIFLDTLDITNT